MIHDAERIAAALAGTALAGRTVVEVPMPSVDELAYGVECGPDEVLAAWQAARSAWPVTGRWPLAVWEWGGFSGPGWLTRLAADRRRLQLMQAELRYATGDHTLGRPEFLITVPDAHTALAERLAALASEHEPPAGGDGGEAADDGDDADDTPAGLGSHLDWPPPPGPPAVLLLPVANGWDTLVHVNLYLDGGALGSVGRLIAVVRSWYERFGAELVANWGTVLQFVVERPPATLEEAWPLALEQVAVAPCTIELPGVPLRRHARALVGRRTWFLHERP